MPTRQFPREHLAALGIPPDSPRDIEYSDHLLADEQVTVLKYTALRRVIFEAQDDGLTYAVQYETELDTGDYEVSGGMPDHHGWRGSTVEAVEVEERTVTVRRWVPVDDPR